MVERRGPLNSGSERLKVPEVTQGAENGRGAVRDGLAIRVATVLLDRALADPGGDEEGGDAAAKTVESVGVADAVGSLLGVGEVVRRRGEWGRNVVVETTRLVKGKDEESVLPLRTSAKRVVDLLDESFSIRNQATVVHRGGTNTTAGRVKIREGRQVSCDSISVELGHRDNLVGVVRGERPSVSLGLRTSTPGSIPVVEPREILLGHGLENRGKVELVGVVGTEVGAVTVRAARGESQAVRVRRLYAVSHPNMKVVERCYLHRQDRSASG